MERAELARVLVVERGDDARVADVLTAEGFLAITAPSVSEALECIASFHPDVVLLEVAKVTGSVLQLCAAVRGATSAPIALVSGRCDERDVVSGLSAGADVFVAEPVGSHELVARVRAMLRRAPSPGEERSDLIVVGAIVLDSARRELSVRGERVPVPRREFDIAELLMRKAGRVVSRVELVQELWGSARDTKSLDVQVGRLRAKLTAAEGRQRIVTVRGVGFRFVTDEPVDIIDVRASRAIRAPAVATVPCVEASS